MIYVITNGEQYIRTNPNGRLAWSGNPTLANSFETFPAALGFLKTKRGGSCQEKIKKFYFLYNSY